jgi:hypothetical protein
MPNWCSNKLVVSGPADKLIEFVNTMPPGKDGERTFSFQQILPYPKELDGIHRGFITIDGVRLNNWRNIDGKDVGVEETEVAELVSRFGAANHYDYACKVWGTKWDVCDATPATIGETEVYVHFDTA